MLVAGLEAEGEHGGEAADRVALVAVQHQLRLRGGAGGEIEQQGVGGVGGAVWREGCCAGVQGFVGGPARGGFADRDAGGLGVEAFELGAVGGGGDDVFHAAAGEAVGEVGLVQQGGGGDDDGAELDGGEHHLPQRHDVAEHEQDAVAALHAEGAHGVGDAVGAFGELGEGEGGGALAFDLEGWAIGQGAVGELGVEPIEREVELVHHRPAEIAVGGGVVGSVVEQELAGLLEGFEAHLSAPFRPGRCGTWRRAIGR